MILNKKKIIFNIDNFKHTVELVKTFGTTPTVDKGSQSQDDLLRRRRQHIARLNIPKSSTSRALSRFSRNSTAIFCGKSTSANLSSEDRFFSPITGGKIGDPFCESNRDKAFTFSSRVFLVQGMTFR